MPVADNLLPIGASDTRVQGHMRPLADCPRTAAVPSRGVSGVA